MMGRGQGFFASGHTPTLVAALLYTLWVRRWQPDAVKQSGIFCYRGLVRGMVDLGRP